MADYRHLNKVADVTVDFEKIFIKEISFLFLAETGRFDVYENKLLLTLKFLK